MNLSHEARFLHDTQPKAVADLRRWLSHGHALLRRLGELWAARRQRARELNELCSFTDQDLADLGLYKSDLPAIEAGTYRRD